MSEPQTAASPKSATPIEARRLVGAHFVTPINFAGVVESVSTIGKLGQPGIGIVPARLDADGDWSPIEKGQQAHGLGLTRPYMDTAKNVRRVERCFVPLHNVRCLTFAE